MTVTLPGGFIDAHDRVHREAVLAPLTGQDEEYLAQKGRAESASSVTGLLARCVTRLGSLPAFTEDIARQLLVADRQYLLLKLRETTFGEKVEATVACPWPGCKGKVDIDFRLDEMPVTEMPVRQKSFTARLPDDAAISLNQKDCRLVEFRLPNGGDQELLSPLLAENEALALTKLLRRCLLRIEGLDAVDEELVSALSPKTKMAIEREMAKVAPRIDTELTVACPECEKEFSVPFDCQSFFFGEFRANPDQLYREVHYLAFHYHWSEREILSLPQEKRKRYIDILAEEIETMNNAD